MKLFALSIVILISIVQSHAQDTVSYYREAGAVDFSKMWILDSIETERGKFFKRPEPLGFIGDDYQRFQIHFTSVVRSKVDPYEYVVRGKTKVRTNIGAFHGTLHIDRAFQYRDNEFPGYKLGRLEGRYLFFEDRESPGSGSLRGTFNLDWFLDGKNKPQYNALWAVADGFTNNEFRGAWTSYRSKLSKKCNWGDFRIPDCGDLDSGAGEFGVNTKYLNHGWRDYSSGWDSTTTTIAWWR